MSLSKPKKDKGKAIQRAEDYQLTIPTQNQFQPLTQTQFPPLPYKNAIMNTKLRGIAHSFFNQMFIHGSLISMNNVQILFQFGFSIGGQCLVVHRSSMEAREG